MPNAETQTVDFVLNVEPGRKIYVNEINITGNNKTRDEVVRRELRQMESAPYDTSKLQRSKERVELLGYFDNVQFDAVPVANTPDQVDLNMSVNERSTGSLDMSAGWVQDTGLVMSVGVSQDNLFGTGKSVSLRASRSKTTLNGSLSFTDPYFHTRRREPRLRYLRQVLRPGVKPLPARNNIKPPPQARACAWASPLPNTTASIWVWRRNT